jgi:hypothetical protein
MIHRHLTYPRHPCPDPCRTQGLLRRRADLPLMARIFDPSRHHRSHLTELRQRLHHIRILLGIYHSSRNSPCIQSHALYLASG